MDTLSKTSSQTPGIPTVVTETLGGSALSRAGRRGELSAWYRPVPSDREAWIAYAREVSGSVAPTWLDQLRPAMSAAGLAAARLERVRAGNGIVITTGQQPGLFGGPLMTLVKALSARALADVLEADLGIPVAPVFWAATDDADFDEAAVVSIVGIAGVEELRIMRAAPTGTPMAKVPIGADVATLAERLRDACGSVAHPAVLDIALREYRAGATVGGSYVALLRAVLEPLGMAVLDASHPAVTDAGKACLRRAVERAERVASALGARGEAIRAAGFTPQVEEVKGLSLVFANEPGGKRRLSLTECAGGGGDTPLSATVLLRPVLERSILPTAAYVAGPGEFAYFAQVSAVADALSVPTPMVVPRWSATIVEPRVQRLLNDFGVPADAVSDPAALEGRVARELVPENLASALGGLRDGIAACTDRMARANDGLVADAVIEGVRRSMLHRLERAERRFLAAVKRRETDAMRRVAVLRGSLFPYGAPQERALSYVPFLARYGQELIDEMVMQAETHARGIIGGVQATATPHAAVPAVPARR